MSQPNLYWYNKLKPIKTSTSPDDSKYHIIEKIEKLEVRIFVIKVITFAMAFKDMADP